MKHEIDEISDKNKHDEQMNLKNCDELLKFDDSDLSSCVSEMGNVSKSKSRKKRKIIVSKAKAKEQDSQLNNHCKKEALPIKNVTLDITM